MTNTITFKKLTIWGLLLCLFAMPNGLSAQSPKDTIKKNLGILEMGNDRDTTAYYRLVDETLQLTEAEKDYESMASCYKFLITYLDTHSQFDRALEIKDRMIALWENTGEYDNLMFDAWMNIVQDCYNNNNIVVSMDELLKMRKFATERQNHYGLACVYISLGAFYINSYDLSMKNLDKALEHLQQSPYQDDAYYIYYSMAYTAANADKWKESLKFVDKMEEASKDMDSDYVRQMVDYMRLNAYGEIGDKAHAKECFDRLNEDWKQYKIRGNLESLVVSTMIQYHCKYGDPNEVPELLRFINDEYEDMKYDAYALYYKSKGNYKKAVESLDSLIAVKDRMLAEQQEAELANANAYFNNQQLEEEKQQMAERYQRNMLVGVSIFAALLILWIAYLIFVLRKLRKAKAELQASHDIIVEQNEKVKASEEMKTAFIQSMSHEIRTPLNHIVGFASLLTMEGLSAKKHDEAVNIIQDATAHMTHIFDNMLEMAVLISTTDKPEKSEVNVNELCSMLITEARNNAGDKPITFQFNAAKDPSIVTSPLYLNSIVRNLLENAVKFTEKGIATITVEDAKDSNSPMRIIVTDTGCGIPLDKQEYVFERFTKGDAFVPGTGVGLYLSRLMITRLGGRIYVDPEYTNGCRIIVEVPQK